MLLEGFQKPARLNINRETLTDTYGMFYAQPFEKGFGITVGNALRRVLISSIEGAAITAVKIGGVLHEFSTIPGVVEDVTDIILNLKQIPIQLMTEHQKIMTLHSTEVGPVTAGIIKHDADIKILNPDLHVSILSLFCANSCCSPFHSPYITAYCLHCKYCGKRKWNGSGEVAINSLSLSNLSTM